MLRTLALCSVTTPFLLAACSGGSGGGGAAPSGMGSIAFDVTDAPIDPALIRHAVLEVDAVRVHREADGDTGFTTFWQGGPVELDLARLRNGLTQGLNGGYLEPGTYNQVRVHVTAARLELQDGRVFSTADDTIRLTSQDTSGYKIFLNPPVVIRPDVETRVLLDFQLPKTFSPIPANDLDSARLFHLHPNVRTAILQETGELRGVVTTTDANGAVIPADGAAVYVLAPGESDPDLALATTLTDASGQAAILGVPVGTYDVLATLDGRSGLAVGLTVSLGGVTDFEIALE